MSAQHYGVLHKIRETRELRALGELEASNRVRDESVHAAQQLEAQLVDRKNLQMIEEAGAYGSTVGLALPLQDIEIVKARIASEEARIAALALECKAKEEIAESAIEKASQLKDHYATLLRAKKGWERVMSDEDQRSQLREIDTEELEFEFISHLTPNV